MKVDTVPAVIKALGGERSVAEFTGRSSQQIWNWKQAGEFPAKYFVVMTTALASRGKAAPARLWGQVVKQKRRDQGVRRNNGCKPQRKTSPA